VLEDGAIGGFIAYSLISIYFAVLNVAAGKSPWHTLETLTSGLFSSTTTVQMIAFNSVHLIAFVVLGILAAFMIREVEFHPAFWHVVFFISIVGFMLGYVMLSLVTAALANLSPVTVALGNIFAAVGMATYLFVRHRTVHEH
jgi:hypothetical protein